MILLDGPTATKEGDKEDDTSDNDEEDRGREELISQEVKILTVGSLHHSSYHNEKQTWELEIFHNLSLFLNQNITDCEEQVEEEEGVLDTFHAGLHDVADTRLLWRG